MYVIFARGHAMEWKALKTTTFPPHDVKRLRKVRWNWKIGEERSVKGHAKNWNKNSQIESSFLFISVI